MSMVLQWVKNNVYIVIFVVLMLAAAVAMPIVSGKMNEKVQSKVQERVKLGKELRDLEKTQYTAPGGGDSQTVLVNQNLLDDYRDAVDHQRADADKVYEAALQHNSKGRGPLVPALLPKPAIAEAQVLQNDFFQELRLAFEDLLVTINAGSPPDPEEVEQALRRKEANLLTQTFFVENADMLAPEDRERLRESLTETRTAKYVQNAEGVSLFASLERLVLPPTDGSYLPTMAEIYEWQWKYWIVEDLALALADANADSPSVITAPVKRVLAMEVTSSGSADGGATGGTTQRGGQPTPLNRKAQAALDFSAGLTGRKANPLYDVRYVEVSLIVDADRIPAVLDALARRNFITAVNLELVPADAYAAAGRGYFYGSGRIARLDVTLETIWLREWMKPFMPDSVREALGVPPDPQTPATTS